MIPSIPITAQTGVADGVLIVNKEAGWTSHDVVAKVRGLGSPFSFQTMDQSLVLAKQGISGLIALQNDLLQSDALSVSR